MTSAALQLIGVSRCFWRVAVPTVDQAGMVDPQISPRDCAAVAAAALTGIVADPVVTEARPSGRLVAGRTLLKLRLFCAGVAAAAQRLGVPAHQLHRVAEIGILRRLRPVLPVTDPVGAEARVVRAILDRPMALGAGVVRQQTMVPDKVGLTV